MWASQVAQWQKKKNLPANVREIGSIFGSGRFPEIGNDNLLQYSCLEIPWTKEPSRLQSMESQKHRTSLSN